MILELAGARALDRPMAGIVNARGHFVEHRPVLRREELKRQHAHIIERLGDRAGKLARFGGLRADQRTGRSEEHTSELQSLMRISYAVFCLKKKNKTHYDNELKNTYVK